jgi:hypothetical protein
MSSLRDKVHWVRCKLHVHRWRPEKDYQGKWYRECRDCGTVSGMSMFHLAPDRYGPRWVRMTPRPPGSRRARAVTTGRLNLHVNASGWR